MPRPAQAFPEDLARVHSIQKYRATGMEAVFHVAEHFSHHAGQIILLTKMLTGSDLKFTQLPGERRKKIQKAAGMVTARRVLLEHMHLFRLKYESASRDVNPIDGDCLGLIIGHAFDQQGAALG